MSDIWSALRPQLETFTGSVPLAALAEADSHRDELAPQLVAELQRIAADPAAAQADGYVLHLYAMLLLARWRDSRAYAPLAELGHLDEAAIDAVFGQLGHASYGRALASTCDGDIAPLTTLADDADASAWARSAALEALTLAAVEHRAPAAPVADFLNAQPEVGLMLGQISGFLRQWLPSFAADQRSYLTVAIGCTGGQHRSVYLVETLARQFASHGHVLKRHRELDAR